MPKGEFILKLAINLLFWVLVALFIGYVVPLIFHLFGDGTKPKPINFQEVADGRVLAAQLFAAVLGGLTAWILNKNQPQAPAALNPAAPNPAGPNVAGPNPAAGLPAVGAAKSIADMFTEEAFSTLLNFGSLSFVIAVFLRNPQFLIATVLCYLVSYALR